MSRWDESEHPRWPAGSPGDVDGQFRPKGGAARDLATLSRSTLLKYARERGLVLPRGTDDDTIRQAIRRFDSGVEPEWIKRASDRITAKKAPAKKVEPAGTVRAEGYSSAANTQLRVVADGKGGYIGQRQRRSDGSWHDDPSLGTGNTPRDITSRQPRGQWRMVRAGKEPTPLVGAAFNSRKHPAGTRVVWHPEGEEPVYGTVGKKGRFTVVDWDTGRQESVRAGVNHEDIRVVSDEQRMDDTRRRLGLPSKVSKLEQKVENLRGRLELARDKRKAKGERQRGRAEIGLEAQLRQAKIDLDQARREGEPRPFDFAALRPTSILAPDEQARVRRLIRRDPQIFATTHKRYGDVSTSGNLGREDAAWLQQAYKRDRVFVEYVAQLAQVDQAVRRAAEKAGQSEAQYRLSAAAELKQMLADRPVAVRVRDEEALRDILGGGRFKTQHEGVRRAAGLGTEIAHRRLGEQILGIPLDTPPEQRPVYGYVAIAGIEPALSAGVQIPGIRQREGQEDVLSAYGQIQVVLKSGVRSRTTVTVGDSLDEIGFMRPTPIDNPSAESLGHGRLDWLRRPDFTRTGYVEAQIHGGIKAEDIQEVVFARQPTAAVVAALDGRGIPWRVLRPGDVPQAEGWASRAANQLTGSRR